MYRPEGKKPAPAVVVCPGGAYGGLAIGHEGYQVAEWFAARGFAAVVLKYTMPHGNYDLPRRDVQQAIELVRANAAGWGVDPARVGVIGFSAGGHLASTAATHFTCDANRPDFAVLVYPVITMDERFTHAGSRRNLLGEAPAEGLVAAFSNELRVTSGTPPTFIAFSDDDDGVPPVNGTLFYNALKAASVPGEIHIYPTGGHGWGWNETFKYKDEFRNSLVRWDFVRGRFPVAGQVYRALPAAGIGRASTPLRVILTGTMCPSASKYMRSMQVSRLLAAVSFSGRRW